MKTFYGIIVLLHAIFYLLKAHDVPVKNQPPKEGDTDHPDEEEVDIENTDFNCCVKLLFPCKDTRCVDQIRVKGLYNAKHIHQGVIRK